ncbi:MAG: PIG-L deacetylase family protein [Candidatus Dormibacteria bacterium]
MTSWHLTTTVPSPVVSADNGIKRALVVVAHPDDVDFGCAGTIAKWTGEGIDVSYCMITSGDAGGFDNAVDRAEMARIRQEEQCAAAAEVGVSDVVFLGYPDGRLSVSIELRRDIARVIRQRRPDRVISQSPERNWQRIQASHPDHLAAGEATIAAVYPDARNPFAHPELLADEGLKEHTVRELWVAGMDSPDTFVDVTETFDRKVAALRRHVSQVAHHDDLEGMLRGWLTMIAERGGLPEGRLAEAFRVVNTA